MDAQAGVSRGAGRRAREGDAARVRALAQSGVDLDAHGDEQATPLQRAVQPVHPRSRWIIAEQRNISAEQAAAYAEQAQLVADEAAQFAAASGATVEQKQQAADAAKVAE
jgi:hypothetical protein